MTALFSRSLIPSYALPTTTASIKLSPPRETEVKPASSLDEHHSIPVVSEGAKELPPAPMEQKVEDMEDTTADSSMSRASETEPSEVESQSSITTKATNVMGRALFPPRPLQLVGNKRLSLPHSTSTTPPKANSSTTSPPRRKSLSPTNRANRTAAANPSSAAGTLLAIPLARQLHVLKARNASLEASLAALQADTTSGLYKATNRIATLEQEAEGWEAEAARWAAECDAARREIAEQKDKRRATKDLVVRLKCELVNRKWKEKWELAVMDAEDRRTDAAIVELEQQVVLLQVEVEMAKLNDEEQKEIIDSQAAQIDKLEASRALLLDSSDQTQATTTALKAEIAKLRSDLKKVTDAHGADRGALVLAQGAVESSVDELAAERDRADQNEKEIAQLKKALEKSEGSKEVAEAKKAVEKEKAARIKAVDELKELKVSLKQAKADLRDALVAAKSAAGAKKVAPLPSVKSLAARKRTSLAHDGSDRVEEAGHAHAEVDDEHEGEPRLEPELEEDDDEADVPNEDEEEEEVPPPPKPTKGPAGAIKSKLVHADSPRPDVSDEVYRPAATKSRSAPAPKPTRDQVPTSRKRKAPQLESKAAVTGVLADKSANAKATTEEPKPQRETAMALEADAGQGEKDGDGKKKKRKLWGGSKKFDWGQIEKTDVNAFGLPSVLSPVKAVTDKKPVMGGLWGRLPASRASVFG